MSTTTTTARDALLAFYAAHPDVENADGDQFLELPEHLTDELDALLLNAAQEKAIDEHLAQCGPCQKNEFGPCVSFLPDGTVRCDNDEDGWDGVRYDYDAAQDEN